MVMWKEEGNVLFNDDLSTFYLRLYGRKEGNVLFNDDLSTFYLRLYGRKEGNVLFNDDLSTFYLRLYGRKEGNVLFNDTLNTFYLWLYGIRHIVKDHSDSKETRCCHMGYSFRLAARVLLYASSHREDNNTTAFVTQVVSTGWNEK